MCSCWRSGSRCLPPSPTPAPTPTPTPFQSKRTELEQQYPGVNIDLPIAANVQLGTAFRKFNPVQKAFEKPVREVLQGWTPEDVAKKFGSMVTPDTPYGVANAQAKLMENQNKINAFGKDFIPVRALQPLAQEAAMRAGLGPFVTTRQAYLLQQGNLPALATADEIRNAADINLLSQQAGRITQLANELQGNGVGFFDYAVNKFGQYEPVGPGAQDPRTVELYSLINSANSMMIYMLSGKQINEQEYERLKGFFPDPQLGEGAFGTRLQTWRDMIEQTRQTRAQASQAAGKRGDVYGQPAAAPQTAPGAEDRVPVIAPDGRSGTVPRAKLQEKLQQGYRTR